MAELLVFEDEEAVVDLLDTYIPEAELESYESVEKARRELDEDISDYMSRFDFIVTDYTLPGSYDGGDVAELSPGDTDVIVHTAYDDPELPEDEDVELVTKHRAGRDRNSYQVIREEILEPV